MLKTTNIFRNIKASEPVKSDEELFFSYCAGNHHAFAELYARYKSQLYTFCVRMVGERDRAGDAFQETFLRLIKYQNSFKAEKKFGPWLFAIARNACLRILEDEGLYTELDEAMAEELLFGQKSGGLDFSEKKTIADALLQLPANLREVIMLYEYEGFSYDEIMQITNVSMSLVKVRIHRARNLLREILDPVFGDENK